MSNTDPKTQTDTAPETGANTRPGGAGDSGEVHTELRRAPGNVQPRSKVLPPEVRDDADMPDAEDPFNDVPV